MRCANLSNMSTGRAAMPEDQAVTHQALLSRNIGWSNRNVGKEQTNYPAIAVNEKEEGRMTILLLSTATAGKLSSESEQVLLCARIDAVQFQRKEDEGLRFSCVVGKLEKGER